MSIQNLIDAESVSFAFIKNHVRRSGLIALPVYGNPAHSNPRYANGAVDAQGTNATASPCRIVRLHAPIEQLSVTWQAIKKGAAPLIPNPYLFDTNSVFLNGRRSVAVPMDQMGYRGNWFSMSGEYTYAMVAPVDLNSSMPIGVSPWERNIAVDDSIVPNVNFLSNLLEKWPEGYTKPEYVAPSDFKPKFFDPSNPNGGS